MGNEWIWITLLAAGGTAAVLFLTPQGRDLLAQLQGLVSFETYDPKKTDLFPFATDLENARKQAKDFVADLGKDTDFLKGLTGERPTKLPVVNPRQF